MARVQDADLWGRLLGLESPWTVGRIVLNVPEQKADVYLEHGEGELWPCPQCGKKLPVYDHKGERVWRHLDTMAFQTSRLRRSDCAPQGRRHHGDVATIGP